MNRPRPNYTQSSSNESEESDKSEDDSQQPLGSKSPGKQRSPTRKELRAEQNKGVNLILVVSLVTVAALAVLYMYDYEKPDYEKIAADLKTVLIKLKSKFPTQTENLWGNLLSVLTTVSSEHSSCPKVLLLLDEGSGPTERTSHCIVKKVTNLSAPILPFKERKALYLHGEDLNCSGCIEVQRENVKKHGIVVIQNLETFPIASAEALHFFCDEHETEFAKAAYLITLSVSNIEKNPTKTAETALRTLWKSMPESHLEAVISRLTSLVVFVQPETALNCD